MTDPSPAPSVVTSARKGSALVATMANPPANQLGPALIEGLEAAVDTFEDSDARVLVIASAREGFFAAGADIKFMRTADAAAFTAYGDALRAVLDRIAGLSRPSIAAIDGLALGGGLELALACSLRIASREARLGLPEPKLGLIPGAGGTQRLPRLVGPGVALEMMLTAREVPADEALRIGLVSRVVEPGTAAAEAVDLAGHLAQMSRPALDAVLRCVEDAGTVPLAEGMANEAARVAALFDSPDGREGLAAFIAKRPARFA